MNGGDIVNTSRTVVAYLLDNHGILCAALYDLYFDTLKVRTNSSSRQKIMAYDETTMISKILQHNLERSKTK